MKLRRSFTKMIATTLAVVMLFTTFCTSTANAGLFSKIKDAVTENPVKTALASVAAVGGAVLAAPYIASAVGFASGSVAAIAGGATATVAGAGAGLAGIGATIWGGLSAAGGFVTGTLGAIGGAIGSVFSGIAGFIGGIVSSPLFIPALCIVGVAVVGYFLWKNYKRQSQDISNSNDIVTVSGSDQVSTLGSTASTSGTTTSEVVVAAPTASTSSAAADVEAADTTALSSDASTELKDAHAAYITAYNKYINLVTNVGGSENIDEELRSNLLDTDTQTALTEYREAYNTYVTLLRQSNSN